jgi:hypothetical protein
MQRRRSLFLVRYFCGLFLLLGAAYLMMLRLNQSVSLTHDVQAAIAARNAHYHQLLQNE